MSSKYKSSLRQGQYDSWQTSSRLCQRWRKLLNCSLNWVVGLLASGASNPHDNMFGHIALPSPVLVSMVYYCDQSYFGWTCSPLLITLLQNIMFNSWISQFCIIQLGVALQKDDCCACEVFEWLERQGIVVQAAGDGERCERSVSWGSHCSGRVKPIGWSETFRGQRGKAGSDRWEKTTLGKKVSPCGKRPLKTCPLMIELQWCWR